MRQSEGVLSQQVLQKNNRSRPRNHNHIRKHSSRHWHLNCSLTGFVERARNVGYCARRTKAVRGDPSVPETAGFTQFRDTIELVEQHLAGPRGEVMPTLYSQRSTDADLVSEVGFRFPRDRRCYLEHIVPFRERRAGYPTRQRTRSRCERDASSNDGENEIWE